MTNATQPMVYSIEEAGRMLSKSRTSIYDAIQSGALRSFKDGRRRKVTAAALREYVAKLEQGRAAA